LPRDSETRCPLCGNKVPAGVTRCPICATELGRVSSKKSPEELKSELLQQDFLHREIPELVLPEARHSCPMCALELKGTETKCPRCGVPLAPSVKTTVEAMLECPECGSLAPFGAKSCPSCGVDFEEQEEAPAVSPPEVVSLPPQPARPEPVPERPMPHIVSESPAPPLHAGEGLVNGRGATSATGLVNGTGMINGTRGEAKLSESARQRRFVTRWQFLAILAAIVVVVPAFIYLSYSHETTEFVVDGNFSEWSSVDTFSPYIKSGATSIDIDEWAVVPQSGRLFMYLRTDGSMMMGSDVSSFYLFVDLDNSQSTGYTVSDIGADYVLEIDGWNGSVQSTSVSQYSSGTDQLDWNAWNSLGSMSVSASGDQLEAMAGMPVSVPDSSRFMLLSQNAAEQNSMSYTVPGQGGLLVIHQEPSSGIGADGTVPQSSIVAIMRLNITCDGADGTINSISGGTSGLTLAAPIEGIDVYVGVNNFVDVMVDTSSVSPGTSVSLDMALATIDSTFSDVEILGEGVGAYVGALPSSIQIDGAFGDWAGKTTADSDSVPNANANIDIGAVGAVNDSTASYFYVSVLGTMCGGSFVPLLKQIPSGGGGGGIVIPTRKTGEDVLDIYVDCDLSSSTGYPISISSKVIGAEKKIEIRGLDGKIVSKSLFVYSAGGQWTFGSTYIDVAKDMQRIELSVSSSSLNGASSIDYIVETTDWRDRSDLATSVPQGTRAVSGGLPTGASINSWIIDSSTTSSSATAMSYQRKLFYDGTNFWSFYYDGANTVYKYSTNGGVTWTAGGRAFTTNGVSEASIWYGPSTNSLYIVGDRAFASTTVRVRSGTVSPSTQTINWAGNDVSVAVSTRTLGGKNTYISRDSTGYIWVLASNRTQTTPVYDLTAFRSRQTDSIASFFATGNMIGGAGDSVPTAKGSIVSLGSGAAVLAVFGYDGNVAARTYSSSTWSTMTTICAIGAGNPGNTENAPPCVVVDAKGVAHVVYGDGHQQPALSKPFIYYVYYNGAWSVPYRLDSVQNNLGNIYPTISLDRSTGNVFAFWIETDTSGVGYAVNAKKNVTGTWITLSLTSDITYIKQYLTSVYSAPDENGICWQWTQNTTGTIEVQFDKIPEFQQVALPVFVMIGLFSVVYRRGRRSRGEDSEE
jgi:hypothetical protein